MKSMRKITAMLMAMSLILAVFTFSASAAGVDDLNTAVAQMSIAEGYSNRQAAALNAMDIYNGLDDAEKEQVAHLYLKIQETIAELDEIKAMADEFIMLVATISDVAVGDIMGVIERAEVLVVDQTYPGITEAKQSLAELKAAHLLLVENCLLFIDAVAVAEQLSIEEYLELKAAVAEAEKYISSINQSYPGVSGAYLSYTFIISEINTKERYTEGIVSRINAMINAETYIEKLTIQNEIANLIRDDNYLPDYAGLTEELLLQMAETEEYMGQCVINATRFILMVDAVATAENYRGALIACYPYLEGVDLTVDGAEAAKDSFDEMVEEYNEVASYCNSLMSGK